MNPIVSSSVQPSASPAPSASHLGNGNNIAPFEIGFGQQARTPAPVRPPAAITVRASAAPRHQIAVNDATGSEGYSGNALTAHYRAVDYAEFRQAIDDMATARVGGNRAPSGILHSAGHRASDGAVGSSINKASPIQPRFYRQKDFTLITGSDGNVVAKLVPPHVDHWGHVYAIRYYLPVVACKLPLRTRLAATCSRVAHAVNAELGKLTKGNARANRLPDKLFAGAHYPLVAKRKFPRANNAANSQRTMKTRWTTIRLTHCRT